jgi:hypothetical protein
MAAMATSFLPSQLRFQFSLRTLLIAVVLLGTAAGYLAAQESSVRLRKTLMRKVANSGGVVGGCTFNRYAMLGSDPRVGWLRRLLGDVFVDLLVVPKSADEKEFDEIERAFPEATVAGGPRGELRVVPAPDS